MACINQAFQIKHSAMGIQFHLEVTKDSVAAMIDNTSEHLTSSQYVQTTQNMLSTPASFYTKIDKEMDRVLNYLHHQQ
jgi:hypothetical protein